MAAGRLLNFTVLLIICQVICATTPQQCSDKREASILGMMLRNHIFKKITEAAFGDVCLRECYRDVRCQSFNYVFTQDMCELSNRTKEARPEDFVPNSERYYFRRDMNRDIDECVSGVHDCHSSASCTNTVGSYSCSCNDPYTGDGKTCNLPSECQNYNSLTGGDRKVTYKTKKKFCDSGLSGWYRFQGSAGTRMPTTCPPKSRCNTYGTGWLNGGHPTVADGQVSRQACFHYDSSCCKGSHYIKVRNCGAFYVYYLNGTPRGVCNLRYCSTD